MAVPSKVRTEIPDTKIDNDSPVTAELKTFERDNSVHSDERIGIPTASANRQANHAHKGLGDDGSALISFADREKYKDEPLLVVNTGSPATSFTNIDVSAVAVPNLSEIEMQWFDDSASTLNDISVKLQHNDANSQSGLLAEAADILYIGADRTFGKVIVDMETARTGQGVIIAEYFDGVGFVALSGVTDGTASGGDTLAQDGDITFTIPTDWAIGAQAVQAGLDATLFFMRIKQTSAPSASHTIDQAVAKIDTAVIAIFQVRMLETGISSNPLGAIFRKDGTSINVPEAIAVEGWGEDSPGAYVGGQVNVPLASEICEYKSTEGNPTEFKITFVGFKI